MCIRDRHYPVAAYITPEQFALYREKGLKKGFQQVESAPLVRSSYHAVSYTHLDVYKRQGEVLFELVNLTVDGVGKESVAYLCWQAGYDDYCLTRSFYELMQEDPDDVRNQAYKMCLRDRADDIAENLFHSLVI